MPHQKRYALIGTGSRASMYISALLGTYQNTTKLVALCDSNTTRMKYYTANTPYSIPCYKHTDFERMITEAKPDTIIVCTPDVSHHDYIIRAMKQGCDVITEKPMTTTEKQCLEVLQTIQETGKHLRVTFNYRYSPRTSTVKEVLQSGAIGEITQVHFEWLLDTSHGADYFRRWHRNKVNSGGLMVHKATHHFDLINWWLEATPELVFALGGLKFYGQDNAKKRGLTSTYERAQGSTEAKADPFALHLTQDPTLKALYLDAEQEDGYLRDKNVFAKDIDIEDTVGVLVRYDTGAVLSYSLNAYSPWEGHRIALTGTKGRLELTVVERPYLLHEDGFIVDPSYQTSEMQPPQIIMQQQWHKPVQIPIIETAGSHGGGDDVLLEDLFGEAGHDPLHRAAGHLDGAKSILIGIAANRAFETGQPVIIKDLINLNHWKAEHDTVTV